MPLKLVAEDLNEKGEILYNIYIVDDWELESPAQDLSCS